MRELVVVQDVAESAFRRHYAQIYRFVRRRSLTDEQAEDVTQQVFVDAAAARGWLREEPALLLGWLHRVARRRLVDEVRREGRRPANVPLDAARGAAAQEPDYGPEVAEAIARAIARLPEGQREVVILKLLQGRTIAEIARRVDATPAACKMRLVRALEAVRDDLEREGIAP